MSMPNLFCSNSAVVFVIYWLNWEYISGVLQLSNFQDRAYLLTNSKALLEPTS